MAFARILVPLDGTKRSAMVTSYAADIAVPSESRLFLLAVVTVPEEPLGIAFGEKGSVGKPGSVDEETVLQEYLDLVAGELHKKGLDVETEVRRGVPSKEILRAALEWRCDVIAMTTRANRGLKRLVLGSVAEEVLRNSRLPVLLVAPPHV
jgi:nucleotide-binding universal stress UspA family protein